MLSGKYPARRLFRIHWNRKYKQRDRYKPKGGMTLYDYSDFRHFEKDWTFNRRKSAPYLGFGVAYERNPDCEYY